MIGKRASCQAGGLEARGKFLAFQIVAIGRNLVAQLFLRATAIEVGDMRIGHVQADGLVEVGARFAQKRGWGASWHYHG